jgi:hypothetical protein
VCMPTRMYFELVDGHPEYMYMSEILAILK